MSLEGIEEVYVKECLDRVAACSRIVIVVDLPYVEVLSSKCKLSRHVGVIDVSVVHENIIRPIPPRKQELKHRRPITLFVINRRTKQAPLRWHRQHIRIWLLCRWTRIWVLNCLVHLLELLGLGWLLVEHLWRGFGRHGILLRHLLLLWLIVTRHSIPDCWIRESTRSTSWLLSCLHRWLTLCCIRCKSCLLLLLLIHIFLIFNN